MSYLRPCPGFILQSVSEACHAKVYVKGFEHIPLVDLNSAAGGQLQNCSFIIDNYT